MNHFKDIFKFAKSYQKFAWLNVFFNILYAIFNVLSVLGFIPVLGILFGKEEKIYKKPIYEGISGIYDYVQGSINFAVTNKLENGGIDKALLFICVLSFSLFFFKNLFRYLASYVLAYLRNGVVKDIRDKLVERYNEKKKSFTEAMKKAMKLATKGPLFEMVSSSSNLSGTCDP